MLHRRFATTEEARVHYLEAGEGEPVLLLHGWPTSSHLWRDVIPHLAETHRVLAPDLPGFGASDKPDASYSFRYYERVLDGFAAQVLGDAGAPVHLVVHDLGGPIGLYWAIQRAGRLRSLTLLNTVVYPEVSWAVKLFAGSSLVPGLREALVSRWFLRLTMKLGVAKKGGVTGEALEGYLAPFAERADRGALIKTAHSLHPDGLKAIAQALPDLGVPVRAIYGTRDRILPDVAKTMARVASDVPGTEVTALEGCGHFLQEDRPDEVGQLIAAFLQGLVPATQRKRA